MDENIGMRIPRRQVILSNFGPGGPSYGNPGITPLDPSDGSTDKYTDNVWINNMRKMVNSARPMEDRPNPCIIFKVPDHIRQLDPKAYEPVVAPLGPFYNMGPYSSSSMQQHKWQCVGHLLSRHGTQERASELFDECLLELKKQVDRIRSCYSEKFSDWIDDQDVASIMLLDGCFIIHLMLKLCAEVPLEVEKKKETKKKKKKVVGRLEDEKPKEDESMNTGDVVLNIEGNEKPPGDPTMAGLFTLDVVVHDLLKLENQIPFFIVQLLFNLLKISSDGKFDLVDLALQLFKGIHPNESKSFQKKPSTEYHHLLHLFYSSRIPSNKPPKPPSGLANSTPPANGRMYFKWKKAEADPSLGGATASQPKWIPNAMELERAGVKFKKKESADNFLNITFERRKMKITPLLCLIKLCLMFRSGRMEIPSIQIYDYTGPLFRNLIAFEQCYYDTEMYITIYALFMDCIVDEAEDVRLLHLEGILEHRLSNDQAVADLFNQLGNQISFTWEKNYLTSQIKKVNEFYRSHWHKWLAGLRRDYLSNPWAIISVLAAIFLLLLTVEQAVFAVLSYVKS